MQLEVGVVVPFGLSLMAASSPDGGGGSGGDGATETKEEDELSRAMVELRLERRSSNGDDDEVGDGGEHTNQGTAGALALGPTVTVTRERRYQDAFDDGLLYKGERAAGTPRDTRVHRVGEF